MSDIGSMQNRRTDRWHVNREVNVAAMFAIALQMTALIWGASKLDSRVTALETQQVAVSGAYPRLAVLETEIKQLQSDQQDVKASLLRIEDRLIDQKVKP